MRTVFGILMVLIAMAITTGKARSDEFSSEIDQLLRNQSNAIKTIDINYSVDGEINAGNPKNVRLKWEVGNNGRINAQVAMDTGKDTPFQSVWVNNGKLEWHATGVRNPVTPGAFSVHVSSAGKTEVPLASDRGDYSLPTLERLLIPLHILVENQLPENDKNSFIPHREAERTEGGRVKMTYELKGNGQDGELVYELDLKQGLKILSVSIIENSPNGPKLLTQAAFSDFIESNGVWIPQSMHEQWWDEKGDQIRDLTLTIHEVKANIAFSDDDFIYNPPYGSSVQDLISGMSYTVGYQDPFAKNKAEGESLPEEAFAIQHNHSHSDHQKTDSSKGIRTNIKTVEQIATHQPEINKINLFVPILIGVAVVLGVVLWLVIRNRLFFHHAKN